MDDVERIVTICKDIQCKGYEKAEIHKSDFWYTHTYANIIDLYSAMVRLIFFKYKKYLDIINVFSSKKNKLCENWSDMTQSSWQF